MNAGIIAGQMLVLFFMMLAGFIAFKAHIVSQAGSKSLSSVIINIFNPCLIISGVLNKKITYSPGGRVFSGTHCPEPSVHKDDEAAAGGGKQLPSHDDISQPGVYGNPAGAQPVR